MAASFQLAPSQQLASQARYGTKQTLGSVLLMGFSWPPKQAAPKAKKAVRFAQTRDAMEEFTQMQLDIAKIRGRVYGDNGPKPPPEPFQFPSFPTLTLPAFPGSTATEEEVTPLPLPLPPPPPPPPPPAALLFSDLKLPELSLPELSLPKMPATPEVSSPFKMPGISLPKMPEMPGAPVAPSPPPPAPSTAVVASVPPSPAPPPAMAASVPPPLPALPTSMPPAKSPAQPLPFGLKLPEFAAGAAFASLSLPKIDVPEVPQLPDIKLPEMPKLQLPDALARFQMPDASPPLAPIPSPTAPLPAPPPSPPSFTLTVEPTLTATSTGSGSGVAPDSVPEDPNYDPGTFEM